MKKILKKLGLSSLIITCSLTGCGKAEETQSEVKFVDPATIGKVAQALYSIYSSAQADKASVARFQNIKDAISRTGAEMIATIHSVNDNNIVVSAETALILFRDMDASESASREIAYQNLVQAHNALTDILMNGVPESSVAAANALTLITPAVAITASLKNVDDASINSYFEKSNRSFSSFLTTKFPQKLRNQTAHSNPNIWPTKWFTMRKGWMWEGQIVAMFQIIAPMEAEYLIVENAQKQVAAMISAPFTPRSYLSGTHKLNNGWMGIFDGVGGYCGFATPDHMAHAGQSIQAIQGNGFTMAKGYTSTLNNSGLCKIPKIPVGFFKKSDDPAIFWSNGETAYCWVPAMKYVTGPVAIYNYDVHAATTFRKDGQCGNMP